MPISKDLREYLKQDLDTNSGSINYLMGQHSLVRADQSKVKADPVESQGHSTFHLKTYTSLSLRLAQQIFILLRKKRRFFKEESLDNDFWNEIVQIGTSIAKPGRFKSDEAVRELEKALGPIIRKGYQKLLSTFVLEKDEVICWIRDSKSEEVVQKTIETPEIKSFAPISRYSDDSPFSHGGYCMVYIEKGKTKYAQYDPKNPQSSLTKVLSFNSIDEIVSLQRIYYLTEKGLTDTSYSTPLSLGAQLLKLLLPRPLYGFYTFRFSLGGVEKRLEEFPEVQALFQRSSQLFTLLGPRLGLEIVLPYISHELCQLYQRKKIEFKTYYDELIIQTHQRTYLDANPILKTNKQSQHKALEHVAKAARIDTPKHLPLCPPYFELVVLDENILQRELTDKRYHEACDFSVQPPQSLPPFLQRIFFIMTDPFLPKNVKNEFWSSLSLLESGHSAEENYLILERYESVREQYPEIFVNMGIKCLHEYSRYSHLYGDKTSSKE